MIKVLLVEDHLPGLIADTLNLYNGFEFSVKRHGGQGVEAAREMNFDLILMDLRMPVMDGLEAIRQIRKFDGRIPIIALTAWSDAKTRKRSLEAGANAYFAKPPDYAALYRKIIDLLADRAMSRDIRGDSPEEVKRKRLYILKQKQALFGINTPPEVLIEIENLEEELDGR